jgi:hypothetical protein
MRHPVMAMLAALALAGPMSAPAQRRGTSCNLSAYVVDRDAGGLNVRSGPSATAPVLRVVGNAGSGWRGSRGKAVCGSGCRPSPMRKPTRI